MEPVPFHPHLRKVLKSYQVAAASSLSGPSSYNAKRIAAAASAAAAVAKFPLEYEYEAYKKALERETNKAIALSQAHAAQVVKLDPPPSVPVVPPKVSLHHPSTLDHAPAPVAIQEKVQDERSPPPGIWHAPPMVVKPPHPSTPTVPPCSTPTTPHPPSLPAAPIFLPPDNNCDKEETLLEHEVIACFNVGGERRLCLPQILNTVLRDFSLAEINSVCDELHIYCSRCTPDQLDVLKVTGVLPVSAPSCGLITKTDAERLCNSLLHRTPFPLRETPNLKNFFKVYHECFGKCRGIFHPDLYVAATARAIECLECAGVFSPDKFVVHSHRATENKTCHWGFDSANWRSYLLLSPDQENEEKHQSTLDDLKEKFNLTRIKRKKETSDCDCSKKPKIQISSSDQSCSNSSSCSNCSNDCPSADSGASQLSAFMPWNVGPDEKFKSASRDLPAFLSAGPPILLNPERVIPFSEQGRYERHFQPNVALAPLTHTAPPRSVGLAPPVAPSSATPQPSTPSPFNVTAKGQSSLDDVKLFVHSQDPPKDESQYMEAESLPNADSNCGKVSDSEYESTYDSEMALLQRAFTSKVDPGLRHRLLQEFAVLRQRHEERFKRLHAERRLQEGVAGFTGDALKQTIQLQTQTNTFEKIADELKKGHTRLKTENEALERRLQTVEQDRDALWQLVQGLREEVNKLKSENDLTKLSPSSAGVSSSTSPSLESQSNRSVNPTNESSIESVNQSMETTHQSDDSNNQTNSPAFDEAKKEQSEEEREEEIEVGVAPCIPASSTSNSTKEHRAKQEENKEDADEDVEVEIQVGNPKIKE